MEIRRLRSRLKLLLLAALLMSSPCLTGCPGGMEMLMNMIQPMLSRITGGLTSKLGPLAKLVPPLNPAQLIQGFAGKGGSKKPSSTGSVGMQDRPPNMNNARTFGGGSPSVYSSSGDPAARRPQRAPSSPLGRLADPQRMVTDTLQNFGKQQIGRILEF